MEGGVERFNTGFEVSLPKIQHVEEFKDLYKKRFQHELNNEEAFMQLMNLLVLVKNGQLNNTCKQQAQLMQLLDGGEVDMEPPELSGIAKILKSMQFEISAGY